MNLGTLTRPRTHSAEPGQDTCRRAVASFARLMSWQQGALPGEGQAPPRADAAGVVRKRQNPRQSCD